MIHRSIGHHVVPSEVFCFQSNSVLTCLPSLCSHKIHSLTFEAINVSNQGHVAEVEEEDVATQLSNSN